MSAWLHTQQLLMTGNVNSIDIATIVKSALFATESSPTQSRLNPINGANPPALVSQSIVESTMLRDEFTAYANRKVENGQWTDKTTMEYESILDTFVEIVGNKKVMALNKGDIERFVNVVSHLPPSGQVDYVQCSKSTCPR